LYVFRQPRSDEGVSVKLLDGRVMIVTGGASGLGEATARLGVAEGARVFIGDIQHERGSAVAASLGEAATFVRCDVTSESEVEQLVDRAVADGGRLDCMVNNAGIVGAVGPIDELALDDYQFSMAVLLTSVVLGMKHAARVMKAQRDGVIVSVSSVAGVMGGLGPHAYAAAKTAIVGLTRNVAAELGGYGIRVNAVAPGRIATPMTADLVAGDPADVDGAMAYMRRRSPLFQRAGLADDIAQSVAWLASDRAGYISGQTLVVDGGWTTGSPPDPRAGELNRFSARRPLIREAGRRGSTPPTDTEQETKDAT
jgi:NAD(P)-dependent dehydrogenase (short-subunit alcohol dehydrogenase family)